MTPTQVKAVAEEITRLAYPTPTYLLRSQAERSRRDGFTEKVIAIVDAALAGAGPTPQPTTPLVCSKCGNTTMVMGPTPPPPEPT
jgi:hypothetical protein